MGDYTRRSFTGMMLAACAARADRVPAFQVIAHRGEHRRNPENSAPGIEAAAAMGVDFVEIDVRTTADGRFVLMHDASVERTTNGKGLVAGMSFSAISDLRLRGDERLSVTTFDEALEILRRSKSGLYLDAKQISAANIAKVLRDHRMEDRTVVYGSFALLRELQRQNQCRARVMPEARNAETLRSLLAELRPKVVAFDHHDWTVELIAMAKASGFVRDLFVDRLGPNDTPTVWEEALRMGATGIQTDHPAALLKLREKKHEKPEPGRPIQAVSKTGWRSEVRRPAKP